MSKGDKSDITRLEDLGQFDHLDDPEIDQILAPKKKKAVSLDELGDDISDEPPPALPVEESSDEFTSELSTAFKSNDDPFSSEESLPEIPAEETPPENPVEINFDTPEEENTPKPSDDIFSVSAPVKETVSEEIEFTQSEPTTTELTSEPEPVETNFLSSPVFKTPEPPTPRRKPEDFQDVKNFAQNISYGKVSVGGNPPYSVVLKGIRFQEDAQEILSILEEHGLMTPDTQDTIKQGIEHGAVLISQISEYSAIYLAHKLRRFDMEIMVGLSEELHQSKNYENEHRGLIYKENIKQNHAEHLDLSENPIALNNIILATTPTLEGYRINRYIDILTEHALLEEADFLEANSRLEETQIYNELVGRLKNRAFKLKCNGILGVNFQFIPVTSQNSQTRYKVICSGNAVMLSDQ